MFERFTDRARRVLVLAQQESRLLRHDCVAPEHLLLGLLAEGESVAAKALHSLDISGARTREVATTILGTGGSEYIDSPPFTAEAKRSLEQSLREALDLGDPYIGPEHLILGLTSRHGGGAKDVFVGLGVTPEAVREAVVGLLVGRDPLLAIDANDVTVPESTPAPADLLTADDVEAVWRDVPLGAARRDGERQLEGLRYRWSSFEPRSLPSAFLAVAEAQVTVEAFDRYSGVLGPSAVPVAGIGLRATFDARSGALRVLSGSTLFVLTVDGGGSATPELASALARKVLARLAA